MKILIRIRIQVNLFLFLFEQLGFLLEGVVHEISCLGIAEGLSTRVLEDFFKFVELLVNLLLPFVLFIISSGFS